MTRPIMQPDTSEQRVCRFGLYEADLETGTLKRHGIPIRLQEQPFRILRLLLEHPGEIVTREELRTRLWPEGTFVEFDGSLNTALMKLRAVLNDDPDNPRFVETVPKKGYRFIAPVKVLNETAPAATREEDLDLPLPLPASTPPELQPEGHIEDEAGTPVVPVKRTLAMWAGAAALLLAGAALAAVIAWKSWPQPVPQIARIVQLTHTGRVAPSSRIASDGARIYFVSRLDGLWTLMTTSIYGGSVEKVASPFANTAMFDVSPDRTQLLIGPYASAGEDTPLWIWPAHGGVPHRLGDVVASEASWSPAGDLIALAQGNSLLTVHGDGSAMLQLQKFSSNPRGLVWSANGRSIRFTLADAERGVDQMWEIDAVGKSLHPVLPPDSTGRQQATGAWSYNDKYFLFTGGTDSLASPVTDSASNVWAFREGWGRFAKRLPVELSHGPISFANLAASGDSNRFFALGSQPAYQLIRVRPGTSGFDVIVPDAGATDVDVSPDGEWLVYSLRENGALWRSRRDGKERVELTPTTPGAAAPQWSPDGKEVLFTAYFLSKKPQLYVVPSAGGAPRAVAQNQAAGFSQSGDWAPDGKQIVFDYFEGGQSDLRILDRPSGKIEKLPGSEQFEQGRWSPDGRHLAAVDNDNHQIVVYDFNTKKWSVLAKIIDAHGMRWSADGNFIYFQEMADPQLTIYRIRLGRTTAEKVWGVDPLLQTMASQCHFTGVAPDGSVYATLDRGGTDLYALDVKFP